jgi:Tol biopolymer transport system component
MRVLLLSDLPAPAVAAAAAVAALAGLGGPAFPARALAAEARPLSAERAGNAMDPAFSPDGGRVAFEVSNSQEKFTELFIVSVDSGKEEKVQPPAGSGGVSGRFLDKKQVNHEFTWAPGGQLYAFSSSGGDEEFDIYIKSVTVPIGTAEKEGGAAFSSDARSLVYCSASSGEGDLYLLDVYALEKPPTRLTTSPGLDFYAVWSPVSEKRLAYSAMTEAGANIVVIDDVSRPRDSARTLTNWKSNQIKPSWSPDGAWVAFFSNHDKAEHTQFDVYVVQAGGGTPYKVASNVIPSERRGPAWTPDGRGLIVVRNEPNAGDPLVRVDLATSAAEIIPTGTVNNGEPAVWGDARGGVWRLAFVTQGRRTSQSQGWRRVWLYEMAAPKAAK